MELMAMISNMASAASLANTFIDARDSQKLAAVQADLTERLIKAQANIAQLIAMLTDKTSLAAQLEERVRELERNQSERERYALVELLNTGNFAYRLKDICTFDERCGEPPHFICQGCFDIRGTKSVLQRHTLLGGCVTLDCPACKESLSSGEIAAM